MPQPNSTPIVLANRYRLDEFIAPGGMAEVWRGHDLRLQRDVAVKLLKAQLATDPTAIQRFSREAETVARLAHPNIVAVYDTVIHEGQRAVVMQLVEGESLRVCLDRQRRLEPDQVLDIAASVAAALDAAHHAGVVHRDVKPGNILLANDGRILLTDFGIAKGTESTPADDLTNPNVMMGTAKYLAPEQVRGRPLDGRADLYALGLVLYECLAGKVPFKGDTDVETALARTQRDPTPLGRLRPQAGPGLLELVHRLLKRNPDDRPVNGAEVVASVERIRRGEASRDALTWPTDPTHARPAPASPGRDRPSNGRERRPDTRRRTDTPPGGTRVRPQPNRRVPQHRNATSLIVVGLVVVAAIAAVVLWMTLRNSNSPSRAENTSISGRSDAPQVTSSDGQFVPITDSTITALTSFDPKGDNTENESRVRLARDRKTATAWFTNCYQNQYFGAKQGVGLIVKLSGPAQGILSLTFPGSPWNVDVYASDKPAASLDDWGKPISQNASRTARATEIIVNEPGEYLLVMLREVGRDKACSSANPFRGGLSEISFGPAVTG